MADERTQHDVVVDHGKSSFSDLWKKEDYLAIWLGFFILAVGLIMFMPRGPENMDQIIAEQNAIIQAEQQKAPFKTIEYLNAVSKKSGLQAAKASWAKKLGTYISRPQGWKTNPLDSLYKSQAAVDAANAKGQDKYEKAKAATTAALVKAQAAQVAAANENFTNDALNAQAKDDIAAWQLAKKKEASAKKKVSAKPYNNIFQMVVLGLCLALFFTIGIAIMGTESPGKFFVGFLFVFVIALLAFIIEKQATMKAYGIGYAAWAIVIGLLISNTIGTPKWVVPAVQTEYYIKTGLVLLGAEILFNKIVAIGIPGIFVAWVVTPIVLVSTYIFGQKIVKMPSKTLNITISADMSVCGVSAAIATAAACRAKKEELTLAVGLSLIFTAIMMIVMPLIIKATGMPFILGGAWMGGTIDSTGAVAAAGAFLSEQALYVAATIKMIQNVLIGVTAFCVAIYWTTKVEAVPGQTVSWMEIWHRFPKFVLGFAVASIIFSLIYSNIGADAGHTLIDKGVLGGWSKHFRYWFFCLAFASIGLASNFRELGHYFKGGKPLILYVCGQSFNLCLTLFMAWIMFYKVFPEITASI